MVNTVLILKECIVYIFHDEIEYENSFAQDGVAHVHCVLTVLDDTFPRWLARSTNIKTDFLRRYVSRDETWIHHYTP